MVPEPDAASVPGLQLANDGPGHSGSVEAVAVHAWMTSCDLSAGNAVGTVGYSVPDTTDRRGYAFETEVAVVRSAVDNRRCRQRVAGHVWRLESAHYS